MTTGIVYPGIIIDIVGDPTTGGLVSYVDISAIPNVFVLNVLITKKSKVMFFKIIMPEDLRINPLTLWHRLYDNYLIP